MRCLVWVNDDELAEIAGVESCARQVVSVPSPEWTAKVAPELLREYLLSGDGSVKHWDCIKLLPKKMRDELLPQREHLMCPGKGVLSPKQIARNNEILNRNITHEDPQTIKRVS
jgi:hypothetical protein